MFAFLAPLLEAIGPSLAASAAPAMSAGLGAGLGAAGASMAPALGASLSTAGAAAAPSLLEAGLSSLPAAAEGMTLGGMSAGAPMELGLMGAGPGAGATLEGITPELAGLPGQGEIGFMARYGDKIDAAKDALGQWQQMRQGQEQQDAQRQAELAQMMPTPGTGGPLPMPPAGGVYNIEHPMGYEPPPLEGEFDRLMWGGV